MYKVEIQMDCVLEVFIKEGHFMLIETMDCLHKQSRFIYDYERSTIIATIWNRTVDTELFIKWIRGALDGKEKETTENTEHTEKA